MALRLKRHEGETDDEYEARRRAWIRDYRRKRRAAGLETMGNERRVYEPGEEPIIIPAHVLRERDRAFAAGWPSLSAYLLGDPLIGRSALERRH